jgi:DNA polymerase I
MKTKVFLIDASPIFYKAFFAIPPLSSKRGIPTNAVFGFMNTLIRLLKEHKPTHLAICFDSRSNFRKSLYPAYKENRITMDSKLAVQIPVLKDLINTMGIKLIEKEGYEADDLIGMLAKLSESLGADVVIISPDKDMSQLVNENITILDDKNKVFKNSEVVKNEFGVEPSNIVDLLGLSGDVSDGIPGVPGIGGKTAVKLITEFGSVEKILENLDKVKGANQKKLTDNKELALISKKLATIITENESGVKTLFDLERGFIENEKIKTQFEALNCFSLIKKIDDIL